MATIQDEIEEAKEFARKYIAIATRRYGNKWSKLLQLSRLVFSFPFTTSRFEKQSLKLSKLT
jgi:hypothetical protein